MVNDWSDTDKSGNKRFLLVTVMWLVASLLISIGISFILPFPANLAVMIVVFIGISYLIRRRQMKAMGLIATPMNYYCMSCSYKHRQRRCPKCGSNMKRIG